MTFTSGGLRPTPGENDARGRRARTCRRWSGRVTTRTQRGQCATGPAVRRSTWRAGWERLLADVLGWGGSRRAALYEVLDGTDEFEAPWTREELDALWAAVHAERPPVPADDHQAVG